MLVNLINEQVKYCTVGLAIINDRIDSDLLNKISQECRVELCGRKVGSRSLLPFLKLNLWLWRLRPDILHFHSAQLEKMIFYRCYFVRTVHAMSDTNFDYRRMKKIFAISNAVAQTISLRGYDSIVIENGINVKHIKQKQSLRNGKTFTLVQIGRIEFKSKGQDILLRALEILIKEKNYSNISLVYIGDGKDKENLESLIDTKKLQQYVTLKGSCSQQYIFEHLRDYDCLVQPSRNEGFGLTVAEGMAAKIPMIISDTGGLSEIVDNGRFGVLFVSGDPNDLANKIENFVLNGYDPKVIESAYNRVCKMYSVENTAKKYLYEYQKQLKGNK